MVCCQVVQPHPPCYAWSPLPENGEGYAVSTSRDIVGRRSRSSRGLGGNASSLPNLGRVAGAQRRTGGVRGVLDRNPDSVEDALQIGVDIAIPETNDAITRRGQNFVARAVDCCLTVSSVAAAVDFDDKSASTAKEIHDLTVDRRLPAEVDADRAPSSQVHPEFDLLRGHRLAKITGALVGHEGHSTAWVYSAKLIDPTHRPSNVLSSPKNGEGFAVAPIQPARHRRGFGGSDKSALQGSIGKNDDTR